MLKPCINSKSGKCVARTFFASCARDVWPQSGSTWSAGSHGKDGSIYDSCTDYILALTLLTRLATATTKFARLTKRARLFHLVPKAAYWACNTRAVAGQDLAKARGAF